MEGIWTLKLASSYIKKFIVSSFMRHNVFLFQVYNSVDNISFCV